MIVHRTSRMTPAERTLATRARPPIREFHFDAISREITMIDANGRASRRLISLPRVRFLDLVAARGIE